MMFASPAGIWTVPAVIAGSSGITVPYAAVAAEGESVGTDSAVGESDAVGKAVGVPVAASTSVGAPVAADSGGTAQDARIEFAAIRLPVTDAISFKASRRESRPSS